MSDELVVGVDVGSQGTCAQAIDAHGVMVATSYVPHSLAYPAPGWAEQDAQEWLAAVARALDEIRRAADGRPLRAISFGSQLDASSRSARMERRPDLRSSGWTVAPASSATRCSRGSTASVCAG